MPAREGRTHYDVLDVARDASATEIRRAFQRLTLEHHPDRNRDDPAAGARMAEINAAYGVLRDRQKRRAYDASLSPQATSPDDEAGSDAFSDAHAHWERANTNPREWQAHVREVQAELKSWTDERLHAFVLEHDALAEDAASFKERSMHQWFTAVALEEIRFREEQERVRTGNGRTQRSRGGRRTCARSKLSSRAGRMSTFTRLCWSTARWQTTQLRSKNEACINGLPL